MVAQAAVLASPSHAPQTGSRARRRPSSHGLRDVAHHIHDRAASPRRRVVLISFDAGADWIVDRLIAAGKAPAFAALAREGAQADAMISVIPSLTAVAHASLWTGAFPRVARRHRQLHADGAGRRAHAGRAALGLPERRAPRRAHLGYRRAPRQARDGGSGLQRVPVHQSLSGSPDAVRHLRQRAARAAPSSTASWGRTDSRSRSATRRRASRPGTASRSRWLWATRRSRCRRGRRRFLRR